VTPDDVNESAVQVMAHRLGAALEGLTDAGLVSGLLVEPPLRAAAPVHEAGLPVDRSGMALASHQSCA